MRDPDKYTELTGRRRYYQSELGLVLWVEIAEFIDGGWKCRYRKATPDDLDLGEGHED